MGLLRSPYPRILDADKSKHGAPGHPIPLSSHWTRADDAPISCVTGPGSEGLAVSRTNHQTPSCTHCSRLSRHGHVTLGQSDMLGGQTRFDAIVPIPAADVDVDADPDANTAKDRAPINRPQLGRDRVLRSNWRRCRWSI